MTQELTLRSKIKELLYTECIKDSLTLQEQSGYSRAIDNVLTLFDSLPKLFLVTHDDWEDCKPVSIHSVKSIALDVRLRKLGCYRVSTIPFDPDISVFGFEIEFYPKVQGPYVVYSSDFVDILDEPIIDIIPRAIDRDQFGDVILEKAIRIRLSAKDKVDALEKATSILEDLANRDEYASIIRRLKNEDIGTD